VIARKDGTRVKLYSRPGNDLTDRFPLIVEALNKLRPRSCIIDGEAVACGEDGIASFDRNFVFRLFCLRLCLHFGRGDRHPARAVNGGINNPLRVITRASKPCSVCIVAH
jgi:nucleoside-diphosphate-sugar epimerase